MSRQRASTSSTGGNDNQPIIEQTFSTLAVSVDPELLDSIKDLRKQVSTCLKNQALLYQLIGQMKVLEDKFERLSADTESSIAGIRREIGRAECESDEVTFKSPKNEVYDEVDVEDCDPLINDQQVEEEDPEWRPNHVSSNLDAADSIDNNNDDDVESVPASGSESESTSPSTNTNNQDEPKKFKCPVCSKEFSRSTSLYRHQFIHRSADNKDSYSYSCSTCSKKFSLLVYLNQHMKIHARESKEDEAEANSTATASIVCTVCSAQFKTKRHLGNHYKHKHYHPTSLVFPCKLCDKAAAVAFHSAEDLAKHYTSQHPTPNGLHPPAGHECPQCGLRLSRRPHLKRHLLTVHSINKLTCELCSQTFIGKDKLKSHQISHHGKVTYGVNARVRRSRSDADTTAPTPTNVPCPDCQRMCDKHRLKDHINACRGLKPFTCDECGTSFSHRSNLRGHQLSVHRKAGRLLCETCGQSFGNRRDLKMHEQSHTGELNYSCPHSSCPRKFRLKSTLTRHIRLHTGEKPYSCEQCGRSFVQKYALVKHKRAHERGTAKTVQIQANVWRKQKSTVSSPEAILEIQMVENEADAGPSTQVTETEGVVGEDF